MTDSETLRKLVQDQHHLRCTYIRQESVHAGRWSGQVAVFSCTDSTSMLVYAWAEKAPDGADQYVTVLGKPPVRSAHDAVRAYLAGEVEGARSS